MDVQVIILLRVFAVTEFVTDGVSFQHVNQTGLLEHAQRTENIALVNGVYPLFDFHQRKRPSGLLQGTRHQQPVGRHTHSVLREQMLQVHNSSSRSAL